MKFEVTELFKTKQTKGEIFNLLIEKFRNTSDRILKDPSDAESDLINNLIVFNINSSFGSINKTDTTTIHLTVRNESLLCTATTIYKPSEWFWIFFLIGILFWLVGALIPLFFYVYYKGCVQKEIQDILHNIKVTVALDSQEGTIVSSAKTMSISEITKNLTSIKELLDKGAITQQEYQEMKERVLKDSLAEKKPA